MPQQKNGNIDMAVFNDIKDIADQIRIRKASNTRITCTGNCFDWNLDLAKELDKHFEGVKFIYGHFRTDAPGDKNLCVHYWVEVGEFSVDITGSQFNKLIPHAERFPDVLVVPTAQLSKRFIVLEDQTALRLKRA